MLVYIDESGDHNLDVKKLDNYYNVFVLSAVCFRTQDLYDEFDCNFREIKRHFFGDDQFIIHTREITRPSKSTDERIKQFINAKFRQEFYDKITRLIDSSKFFKIACVVKKAEHSLQYGESAVDPYMFSFDNILNRILFRCEEIGCKIYPEERNASQNDALNLAFEKAQRRGTRFCSGDEVISKVREFRLVNKRENVSGHQLVDLTVTPIGRHVLGKTPRPGNEVPFSTIKQKIPDRCFTIFP